MSNPNVPIPHIQALEGEIVETIPLPGDPLRAKYIADNFLKDMKQFNTTRNMFGHTGAYKGERVSVMDTGMDYPPIGIYSHELIRFYGCKNLTYAGTAGVFGEKLRVRDMMSAMDACTTSNYIRLFGLPGDYSRITSCGLLLKVVEGVKAKGLTYHAGSVLSSDMFYGPAKSIIGGMTRSDMGVLAVEMGAVTLYNDAVAAGVNALYVVTISDSAVTGEATTAKERQTTFTNMIEVALSLV